VLWTAPKETSFGSIMSSGDGGRTRFKRVTKLGKAGKAVVYMTRSRAERDLWVTAINMEIERIRQEDDIRII
jgi:hypothetical protein